jgi:hypothetical protein
MSLDSVSCVLGLVLFFCAARTALQQLAAGLFGIDSSSATVFFSCSIA